MDGEEAETLETLRLIEETLHQGMTAAEKIAMIRRIVGIRSSEDHNAEAMAWIKAFNQPG